MKRGYERCFSKDGAIIVLSAIVIAQWVLPDGYLLCQIGRIMHNETVEIWGIKKAARSSISVKSVRPMLENSSDDLAAQFCNAVEQWPVQIASNDELLKMVCQNAASDMPKVIASTLLRDRREALEGLVQLANDETKRRSTRVCATASALAILRTGSSKIQQNVYDGYQNPTEVEFQEALHRLNDMLKNGSVVFHHIDENRGRTGLSDLKQP